MGKTWLGKTFGQEDLSLTTAEAPQDPPRYDIYDKIFKQRKKGSIVSSNTSSIPISVLSEKLTEDDKKDFCITHFFNPVRYMDLLEIVKNENTDLDKIQKLKHFCEEVALLFLLSKPKNTSLN